MARFSAEADKMFEEVAHDLSHSDLKMPIPLNAEFHTALGIYLVEAKEVSRAVLFAALDSGEVKDNMVSKVEVKSFFVDWRRSRKTLSDYLNSLGTETGATQSSLLNSGTVHSSTTGKVIFT